MLSVFLCFSSSCVKRKNVDFKVCSNPPANKNDCHFKIVAVFVLLPQKNPEQDPHLLGTEPAISMQPSDKLNTAFKELPIAHSSAGTSCNSVAEETNTNRKRLFLCRNPI